jgi:hypothetical protein
MRVGGDVKTQSVASSFIKGDTFNATNVAGVIKAGTINAAMVVNAGGGGGGGGATAARSIARAPAERPLPVPVENVRAEAAPSVPAVSPGSGGLTLAAASGTIMRRTADELTMSLPQQTEPPLRSTPARTLSRAETTAANETVTSHESSNEAAHADPGPSANGARPGPHPGGGGGGGGGGGPDLDEITEHVIEEIKRQALFERERSGDLFGDLPT